jgi:hypothetical protein
MHSEYPTIESRLLTGHAAAEPDECQRRLGRVYRLILSYEPQEKAAGQEKVRETSLPVDAVQSVAGL